MFTTTELLERYSQPEVVENKEPLRGLLIKQVAEFESKGGKVTELPYGVKTHQYEIRSPAPGQLDSGYAGITWSPDREKWAVRTTNSRKHLGFADSICEALALQEKHQNKQNWKEDGNQ